MTDCIGGSRQDTAMFAESYTTSVVRHCSYIICNKKKHNLHDVRKVPDRLNIFCKNQIIEKNGFNIHFTRNK